MSFINIFNCILTVLFFICYAYQFFYIPVSWYAKPRAHGAEKPLRYAFLIAARNEEAVIGQLIDSIRAQDYPQVLYDIYVVADNCTDATAALCRSKGVYVHERFNRRKVGKGYALDWLLCRIPVQRYDAFAVFDADNLLRPDWLTEVNKHLSDGCGIVTTYRNTKNYGDNWISAGYGLWFLREARYLNAAREALGLSCNVSGTGFAFTRKVLEDCGGWHFFLLTEDAEFSIDRITAGERIGYCASAEFFDEQPTSFAQSWRQRVRWSRGYLQVLRRYGGRMLRGIFNGRRDSRLSCLDMTLSITPVAVLSALGLVTNTAAMIVRFAADGDVRALLVSFGGMLCGLTCTVFVLGVITTVTEWRHIDCPGWKKVLYTFTLPLFMFTYIPICIASFFGKVTWKPIRHGQTGRVSSDKRNRRAEANCAPVKMLRYNEKKVLHIFWCAPEVSFGGGAGKTISNAEVFPRPPRLKRSRRFLH